ncbi:unnamed protein product [Toxocara canis]|uniref:Uncharacterized protein n=1 Tax=Toxocara canis TaxID=6265 RepID=A0A183V1Q4_TOXCA|nr:unnamed protein product [Toxocara canis]
MAFIFQKNQREVNPAERSGDRTDKSLGPARYDSMVDSIKGAFTSRFRRQRPFAAEDTLPEHSLAGMSRILRLKKGPMCIPRYFAPKEQQLPRKKKQGLLGSGSQKFRLCGAIDPRKIIIRYDKACRRREKSVNVNGLYEQKQMILINFWRCNHCSRSHALQT